MSTSNMFIANGAAEMAFKTNGDEGIQYGVNACGSRCGVFGSAGSELGRRLSTSGVGVWGDGGTVGVQGRGSMVARDLNNNPSSIGVRGDGGKWGVAGFCAEGTGVFGKSMSGGRGGEFESSNAQIRLIPPKIEEPNFRGEIAELLPVDGKTGDLFAVSTDNVGATLWFCERGKTKDKTGPIPASWRQVEVGPSTTGKKM